MNPSEYAWSTMQAIAQKEPSDIKVLVEQQIEYPRLEKDSYGYVLRIPIPTRPRENLYCLHGMFFDADTKGEASLWRMFRASIYHLCLHAVHTDFSIYKNLVDEMNMTVGMFAISLVEDYSIRGFMRANWPGLVLDTAYANHLSALRFKELSASDELSVKMAANLLSYTLVGKPRISIGSALGQQIKTLWSRLVEIDAGAYHLAHLARTRNVSEIEKDQKAFNKKKVETAQRIIETFEDQSAYLNSCPSFPYTDNYGPNFLFPNSILTASPEEKMNVLNDACRVFSIDSAESKLAETDKVLETESSNILADWDRSASVKQSLIESYRRLDPHSHFEGFLFPKEDFAEYVRTRSKLIGPIRLILDQLRMIKSSADEVQGQESGYVDLPTAVQVLASGKQNNDIFVRDILSTKSEAWAILIDSSKSLENIQGAVKDVAICLSEVAKDLIPNQNSWACYAFDERFHIVKDFSEIYGNECRARIGGLCNGVKTYLPDAMRLAAKRLETSGEEVKVLLVISDGFPLGYEGIDNDSVEALKKIEKSGMYVIGIGICSSFLKKHFKMSCNVESPSDLMKNFVRIYIETSNTF